MRRCLLFSSARSQRILACHRPGLAAARRPPASLGLTGQTKSASESGDVAMIASGTYGAPYLRRWPLDVGEARRNEKHLLVKGLTTEQLC